MAEDGRRVRVFCIDDHPMVRDGIATLLSRDDGMAPVGESASVAHGIAQIALLRPDVVLTDLHLPDGTALEVIAAVRQQSPATRVIVFTETSGDLIARRALESGAWGWLLKRTEGGRIIDAILGVRAGRQVVDAEVLREIDEHQHDTPLSERESQVLRLVSSGLANWEIARRLSLAEGTVKNHLAQILEKLGAEDRTHAVVLAMRRGAIALPGIPLAPPASRLDHGLPDAGLRQPSLHEIDKLARLGARQAARGIDGGQGQARKRPVLHRRHDDA